MSERPTVENDAPLTNAEREAPYLCPRCGHHSASHGNLYASCNIGDFLNPCGCLILRGDIPGLNLRAARVTSPEGTRS